MASLLNLSSSALLLNGKSLPDAEIEYLESTGTQYINLGQILSSATDCIDIEVAMLTNPSSLLKVFGARSAASTRNLSVIADPSTFYIDMNNGSYSTYRFSQGYTKESFYIIHMEKTIRSISLNGVVLNKNTNVPSDFTTASNALLFNVAGMGNTMASCRIKSLLWKRNNIEFMNLIPVRVGQTGYMYDKVSGQLFGNAGTGSFTLGNDI